MLCAYGSTCALDYIFFFKLKCIQLGKYNTVIYIYKKKVKYYVIRCKTRGPHGQCNRSSGYSFSRCSMDPILTWIPLLKTRHGPYTHLDTVATEAPSTLYSPWYSCSRGSMVPIITWIPLFKRLHGSYTHLDTVAQEASWSLYSPGYRCSRGSMDPILTWIQLFKRLHMDPILTRI